MAIGAAIAAVAIISAIKGFVDNTGFQDRVKQLEAKARMMENNARLHERNAIKSGEQAMFYKHQADLLRDSIATIVSQKEKLRKAYEDSKHDPVRFVRDSQRDSILSVLYPK